MATVKKNIGSVPVWRGKWASGTSYKLYNIVELDGNAYVSTVNDNTARPATTGTDGKITLGAGWGLLAGNPDGTLAGILLKTAQALTPEEQAQVKKNLGLDAVAYYEDLGEVEDINLDNGKEAKTNGEESTIEE